MRHYFAAESILKEPVLALEGKFFHIIRPIESSSFRHLEEQPYMHWKESDHCHLLLRYASDIVVMKIDFLLHKGVIRAGFMSISSINLCVYFSVSSTKATCLVGRRSY